MMAETRLFWMPDYYERFQCKADRCRTNCCHGWCVTISQQDYFNLLSVPCSKPLRQKLDTALHLVSHPDPQRYAEICHDWLGNCPLQREDGLCGLQAECGEGMLSSTCRYYPRGVRTAFIDECCCSGSCEGVLETMFESRKPIRMVQRELTFDFPLPPRAESDRDAHADRQIQREWIAILQDRRFPFFIRLQRLGCAALALHHGNDDPLSMMEQALSHFEAETNLDLLPAFALQQDTLFLMGRLSANLLPFVEEATESLGLIPDGSIASAYGRYEDAAARLESILPDWDVRFEHMLVNHVLYQGYPYSANHESVWNEYMALCALYAALRILSIGYMATHDDQADFVDVCAAAFKLFEHANFDHNAIVILNQRGMTDLRDMNRLTLL